MMKKLLILLIFCSVTAGSALAQETYAERNATEALITANEDVAKMYNKIAKGFKSDYAFLKALKMNQSSWEDHKVYYMQTVFPEDAYKVKKMYNNFDILYNIELSKYTQKRVVELSDIAVKRCQYIPIKPSICKGDNLEKLLNEL